MVKPLYTYIGLAVASLGGMVAHSQNRWENWEKPTEQIAARVDLGDAQDLNVKPQGRALAPAASDVAAPTKHAGNDTLSKLGQQQNKVQAQVDEAQKKLTSLQAALAETTRLRDEHARLLQKLEAQFSEVQQKLAAARAQLAGIEQTIIDRNQELASIGKHLNITTNTKTLPEPVDETITLAKDSSLADEIAKLGITIDQAHALATAVEAVFPTTMLKEGQQITVTLERQLDFYGQDAIVPVRLSFSPEPNEEIVVEADEDGRFIARIGGAKEGTRSRYAESPYYRACAKVGTGLYSTAKDNGVPDYIVTQMMQVFAYDVDFQRQVNATDTFEIFYGNPLTGSSTKRKVVHYTSLTVGGETKTYFRFTTSDGETGYYDANGRSADRVLMRTPVPGSRISSGFGMRRHPILGYNRMHTGVDFAAPNGTPLKAAGDGVISVAGWQGTYGKVVRIRHMSNDETIYAHMSRIPTTIKPGVAVRQGQVIGFVGSTGRSTGPHAHFEIRQDGKPMNPLKLKATGGRQLTGENLAAFRQHMQKVLAMMKAAPSATRVAHDRWEDWEKPPNQIAARVDPGEMQDLNAKLEDGARPPAASDVAAPKSHMANDTLPHLGEQQKEVRAQVDEVQRKLTSLQAALVETTRLRDERAQALQKVEAQSSEVQQKLGTAVAQLAGVQQTITDRSQELAAIGNRLESARQEAQEAKPTSVTALAPTPWPGGGANSTGSSQMETGSTTGAINQPDAVNPTKTLPTNQLKKTTKKKAKVKENQTRKAKIHTDKDTVRRPIQKTSSRASDVVGPGDLSPPTRLELNRERVSGKL